MTNDPAHGVVLLFGGATYAAGANNYLSDTWTWDGTHWTRLQPVHSPSPRAYAQMAFDQLTGRVVLFGGMGIDGPRLNDTWLWDGRDWTQATPATSPPGTIEEGMTYFPIAQRVVLYSADFVLGNPMGLYAWDGGNWAAVAVPVGPPASSFQAGLSYDEASRSLVLLAYDVNQNVLQHWEYDGQRWLHRSVPTPPQRSLVQTVEGGPTGEVVMFGGVGYNDTYAWDGCAWSPRQPIHAPPIRSGSGPMPGLAFDSARGQVVLFGGWAGGELSDTWTWDGSDWIRRT